MSLPSKRAFLTSLISSIPSPPTSADATSNSNPLRSLSQDSRNILLTLHVLFPNELLPALDLLDRGLVTRLVLSPSASGHLSGPDATATAATRLPDNADKKRRSFSTTYYVRSAQQSSSSSRYHDPIANTTHYQVRPTAAWNCSCPAFAFAAFPALSSTSASRVKTGGGASYFADPDDRSGGVAMELDEAGAECRGDLQGREWEFGGLARGDEAPVCKHLLACVLGEKCSMFAPFVQEREASMEEMCGWAAGWGG